MYLYTFHDRSVQSHERSYYVVTTKYHTNCQLIPIIVSQYGRLAVVHHWNHNMVQEFFSSARLCPHWDNNHDIGIMMNIH